MSAPTQLRHVKVRKVTLIHLRLLDLVKELQSWLPSSHGLTVTVLNAKVLMKRDGKIALFIIQANGVFIQHGNAVFYGWISYQSAPWVLNQIQKE